METGPIDEKIAMLLEVGDQTVLDGGVHVRQRPGHGYRGLGIEQVGIAPILAADRLLRRSLVEVVQASQIREVHVSVGDPGLQRLQECAGFRSEAAVRHGQRFAEFVFPAHQPGLDQGQVVFVRSDQGIHFPAFGFGQRTARSIHFAKQCRCPTDVLIQLFRIDKSGL